MQTTIQTNVQTTNRNGADSTSALRPLRITLLVSGLVLAGVGVPLLSDPVAFYGFQDAQHRIGTDLLSDLRSSGALLCAFAGLLFYGGVSARRTADAAAIGALVFLAYGAARIIGFAVDGMPSTPMLFAAAVEWAIGGALLVLVSRTRLTASGA